VKTVHGPEVYANKKHKGGNNNSHNNNNNNGDNSSKDSPRKDNSPTEIFKTEFINNSSPKSSPDNDSKTSPDIGNSPDRSSGSGHYTFIAINL
jgi:hypothetical protein